MFFNTSKLLFFLCLIIGTFLTISSNSLMGVWMGLEINLLSFIPLMIDTNNLMTTEATLKYFLNQVMASLILLFMMIFYMNNSMILFINNNYNIFMVIMMSTMLMKSGAAPFHFWLPQVMNKINWSNNLILMTIQKIGPMIILSYLINTKFLIFIIIMNMIVSTISGFNQISLRKIMAFSSINHMGWMMLALMMNETLWLNYFIFYSLFSLTVVFIFKNYNLYFLNQMFSLKINYLMKFIIFCSFLSLGGLPPFLGFFPKWLVIQFMVNFNLALLTLMVFCSLIILYFYLRICYSAFMLFNYFNSWKYFNYKNNIFMMINLFTTLMGLFFISCMFMFL
uniref:NADH-ubiquinone oxidoreductase chain 2 n=1 Tax=Pericoma sp. ZHK-2021 TaxID=2905160 RepID=A0A8K1XC29_9DIPT|nr:NADH dehydrogenase subunit 2 [Pericoma sp. ZHK-2021]